MESQDHVYLVEDFEELVHHSKDDVVDQLMLIFPREEHRTKKHPISM